MGAAVLLGAMVVTTTSCSSGTATPAPAASSHDGSMMSHGAEDHSHTDDGPGPMMDADIMFLQMMIPHHQQAIEMSSLASTNDASPDVQRLAEAIAAAQGPEIEQMKSWLDQAHAPDMLADHHMTMSGMLSSSQMSELAAARGAQFDRLYLEGMIGHHQGALQMAQDEIESGENPDVVAFAKKVVTDQTAEIARMTSMLAA
jgi:uncharacterized protein (DUF305 family)